MSGDAGLESKAFPFIRVTPRPAKPRETGLTVLADRGIGMNRVADIVDASGDYIDYFKLGIGAWRLQTEEFLKKKIDFLHNADINTFLAGDSTELAFQQGVSKKFYEAAKKLGVDAVEVSSAQVTMSLEDKCALIKLASSAGLKVVAEAGQKGHEDWTRSLPYIYTQIEAYQKAGAWRVLVQGEGISEGVDERKEDLLLNVVARFDIKDLIFQAKDGDTQAWFVGTFGPNVSLDVDDHQIIDLELMRRGMRKRGVFGLVGGL